jgi:exodeoxyribonuclease VII large subunit
MTVPTSMFTVSQLLAHIKEHLATDDALAEAWLEGEVSNFRQASSGHCYFTLKDDRGVIPCVMWRNTAWQLARLPIDGERVLVRGYVSIYEAQGRLQFYVNTLEPAGLGQLYQAMEALRQKLAQEGLFDSERKRPIPALPRRLGIVTSLQAAALRDILRTVVARYPVVDVLVAPAAVQGSDAPRQIAAAIQQLNRWSSAVEPIDVILVARGGGSIEELWAFNDELVARAIAASSVPIISGVGHETDVTLADFAADRRAATPTGAATLATPDRGELLDQLLSWEGKLQQTMIGRLSAGRLQVEQMEPRLRRASPSSQISTRRQQIDELGQTLERYVRHRQDLHRAQLDGLEAHLASLNPHAVLQRGYAVVQHQLSGQVVTSTREVTPGDRLRILVRDGDFAAITSE